MELIVLGEDLECTAVITDQITPDADLPDVVEMFISTTKGGESIHDDLDLTAEAVDGSPHTWRAIFPGVALTTHLGTMIGSVVYRRVRVGTHVNLSEARRVATAREG